MSPHYKFMIIAGESSGDAHGAELVSQLKTSVPDCIVFGIGGEKMRAAGMEILHDITEMAVVGFTEVVKNFPRFRKIFHEMLKVLQSRKPDALILIDYPGFNLRFARRAKAGGFNVIYYISPQVWAWGHRRLEQIKRDVDRMLVIFPFEEQFYQMHGIDATFVGHPMTDRLRQNLSEDEFREKSGILRNEKIVGILPGSRENEVKRHLPVMLDAARIIRDKVDAVQFVMPPATPGLRALAAEIIGKHRGCPQVHLWEGSAYEVMNTADAAMVSSGTATLETGCFGTPMVIIYRINRLTYLMAKRLIKIQSIGMINIVAEKQITPELIQGNATGPNIAGEIIKLLSNDELRQRLSEELLQVRTKLGEPGAGGRAAAEIMKFVRSQKDVLANR